MIRVRITNLIKVIKSKSFKLCKRIESTEKELKSKYHIYTNAKAK